MPMSFACTHAHLPTSISATCCSTYKCTHSRLLPLLSGHSTVHVRDQHTVVAFCHQAQAPAASAATQQPLTSQPQNKTKQAATGSQHSTNGENKSVDLEVDRKMLLGQQKVADWVATSGITPQPAMSISEMKRANVTWQDTYRAKSPRKLVTARSKAPKRVEPAPASEAGAKPRGFGATSNPSTVKLFRYGLEKAALQQVLVEAGLTQRVVQVERVEDASAIVAVKLTRKGEHIGLQQAERTAANAGIPLVIAGRRLSKDSITRALQPLLDKRPAASPPSSSTSPTAGELDDWDQLEPADEFELWDQKDLESDVFDDEGGKLTNSKPTKGPSDGFKRTAQYKPREGSKGTATVRAGSISFGQVSSKSRQQRPR